jgi:hypothetical protein
MAKAFQLFWLRETGCDAGTTVHAGELEPAIRNRVLDLAGSGDGEFLLRLPFFDRREWRRRDEILAALPLERTGDLIRAVLDPPAATRDLAATLALTHPAWMNAPRERDPACFDTWQRVSLALQRALKQWLSAAYFRDLARLEDRDRAYTMVVYQASRPFYGRPKTEFTFDVRDYPDCQATLASAWKFVGRSMQSALALLAQRLEQAGRPDLAQRYLPVWHEDVLVTVRKKPKRFVDILAAESAVINAVIDLGTDPSAATINRSARAINTALRSVMGEDMRRLGVEVLEEATRVLTHAEAGTGEDLGHGGTLENSDAIAAGGPDARVAGEEDRQDRSAHGGGEVGDAGIVADEQPRRRKPASQFV